LGDKKGKNHQGECAMSNEEEKQRTHESEKTGLGPISRREFAASSVAILGTGANVVAAVPQTANRAGSAPAGGVAPAASAAAQTIKFTVNKHRYELRVEPEWVLRDVLRDHLGLLSIKDMCNGYGACGSCTVIMNGRPVLSCMTFAEDCDGMTIETAESVAINNPQLIEAYVLNHCMQCGYCTPGFLVTAKALLDRIPKPTEEDIRDALGGNICRCGTYTQHILAVKEVIGNA
jgi:aerobic-type carbon monoxide dehydrogenase small subunit (CoxS/CutS family)